jgi:hypothetical protein
MFSAMSGWYAERKREWSAANKTHDRVSTSDERDEKPDDGGRGPRNDAANAGIAITQSFEDITINMAEN